MINNYKYVDILHLEDGNVYRPVLKNKTATMFFLKKPFLVYISVLMTIPHIFKY